MKTVKIACKGAALADIENIHELQGDLKTLSEESYNMLREEIVSTGFAFPIFVWKDQNSKLWIVGGHQRKRALLRLKEDGFQVPKVPIVFVDAANLKEAKRRVLQDIAQYGKVSDTGLRDFMEGAKIDFEEIYSSFKLPDFDMEAFESKYFSEQSDPAPPPVSGQDRLTSGATLEGSVTKVILFYTQSEYAKVISKSAELSAKLGCSNLSQLFSKLLDREKNR